MTDAFDTMIGLDLDDVAVDECNTQAGCGRECAGRSPVDRGKSGLRRSQLFDALGIPLAAASAPANRRDHQMLAPSLNALKDFEPPPEHVAVHPDACYDYALCRAELAARNLDCSTWKRGTLVQVGKRWVVEAGNSGLNNLGKLHRA